LNTSIPESTRCSSRPIILGVAQVLAFLLCSFATSYALPASSREQINADFGWRFRLGDQARAEAPNLDDKSWRTINLPHDWSIEGTPDPKNLTGSGGGYFPAGLGWYRKTFNAPKAWSSKRVSIEFDGVYMNATVYLNGHALGSHPNGYTSFAFDLSPYLALGKANVLAVRVDNAAQPNSRWYTGSGIYRHVRIIVADPVHIAHWGVFVTTPEATTTHAKVEMHVRIANQTTGAADVTLDTAISSASGVKAGTARSLTHLPGSQDADTTQTIQVSNPELWSPESPHLYRATTKMIQNGRVIDEVTTSFGIRSLAWSSSRGFELNGQSIKLHGGSVHSDNGPLGAAAFDRAEERKVELLKAAGNNAVRTAHNPPSPAFLDACDRLGLLVLEDSFDVWIKPKVKYDYARFFDEWWQRDLDSMVLRDRNHPSVIMWGIGNEIPEAWTPEGAPIAEKLSAEIRSLDSTRPLTEAFPGATYTADTDAVFAKVDIGGYNYNLAANQAKDHARVPGRIMLTTESFPSDAFEQWQLTHDNPYILGEFVWTSMDYLGESGIGAWGEGASREATQAEQIDRFMRVFTTKMGENGKSPFTGTAPPVSPMFPGYPWFGSYCGDLDITGTRKPESYYRDILWNGGDRVYAAVRLPEPEGKKIFAIGWAVYPSIASWTWPGHEGKNLDVEVYSGAEKVRLYLNDKLIGEAPTGRDQQFKAMFTVPYATGTLRVEGMRGDRVVAKNTLTTSGKPTALRFSADRTTIKADGQDLSFVTLEAVDAEGHYQPNANTSVDVAITGPGVIEAFASGDTRDPQPFHAGQQTLFNGRALAVVRSTGHGGVITLSASGVGLDRADIEIRSQRAATSEPAGPETHRTASR
jgi:beta-galactosidase